MGKVKDFYTGLDIDAELTSDVDLMKLNNIINMDSFDFECYHCKKEVRLTDNKDVCNKLEELVKRLDGNLSKALEYFDEYSKQYNLCDNCSEGIENPINVKCELGGECMICEEYGEGCDGSDGN